MEDGFNRLQQKYDSLAQIDASRQNKDRLERETLQGDIEKMRGELGIVLTNLENEESLEVGDNLLSDDLAIESGNYVVVSTCKSLLCAEQVQADLIRKGENHTKIVLNKAKGFYYLVTARFSNFDEALKSMEHRRGTGYVDSWVLVYKGKP